MQKLTYWSMDHPRALVALVALVSLAFLVQFPRAVIDTDPENMLEADQPDRVFYDGVKEAFGVEDLIVVGVTDAQGIFRPEPLARLARVVEAVLDIDGVIGRDVLSFSTTDDVTSEGGLLRIDRIMAEPPDSQEGAEAIRRAVLGNPMFAEKLASRDGTAAAFYVPIERKDQSHRIAGQLEAILQRELGPGQEYHIAGLPVAEDTFGYEMFLQMGIMAPLAMLVIFLLMWRMFGKLSLVVPPMIVAMLSVIWGMGALIGSGFTVHIMSSMIPVFLMPIAVLDSVHILSEFHDRYPALGDRRRTMVAVMDELSIPMLYTSLTSAVGFGSQVLAPIPPVRVFGGFVAFGIMAAWLLTITLIPASVMLIREERLAAAMGRHGEAAGPLARWLPPVGRFAFRRAKAVIVGAAILLAIGGWGVSRIVVNDNPVKWFRPDHPIRVADRVMNRLFGGTYMAYLVVEGQGEEPIKRPEVMAWIDRLQSALEREELVGKTTSVADVVQRVSYVLHDGDAAFDAVPPEREAIGQYLFLFQMSGDPDDLEDFVDPTFTRANVWVQLKGGDNLDMEAVEAAVADFVARDPPPAGVGHRWSGLTYINKVWQDLMVTGMGNAVAGSAAVVFVLMVVLFRSVWLALISMVPLTFAIVFAYGIVGFAGKDYDMPIAVCSSLALGLSIDFAIHFVQRMRRRGAQAGELEALNDYMFGEPARAIARNGIVIAVGFLPLVFATLTPYVTVGAFFAALMAASTATTLLLLPALMRVAGGRLCRRPLGPAAVERPEIGGAT